MSTVTRPPAREARAGFDDLGEGVRPTEYDSSSAARRAFRADIQGLRAIAVLAVVLYHAHVPFVTGGYVGVDVFFVISGFLITGHLVAEVERTGRVSVSGFYARRIRRLLPAALLVVVSTVVVAAVWGPVLQVKQTARDGLYAAFYAMNYHLAADGVDYQQANAAPSPFQHFWSLAVEEQFYLFWPLAVLAVALLTRRARAASRRWLLAGLVTVVVVASLHWSIETTASNAPLAYYSLHTRAWELGAGALVALAVPLLGRVPALLAVPLTWAGLALVVVPVFAFDDTTPFPGYLAALPVGGAALVIAAGVAAPAGLGAERFLRRRTLQFLGAVSYGWYLWHWPVLVLGPAVFGEDLSWGQGLLLSVLALWFAVLTYLLVEQPSVRLRFGFVKWVAAAGALSLVVVAAVGAVTVLAPKVQGSGTAQELDLSSTPTDALTLALTTGLARTSVPVNLTPALADASADVPRTTRNGCHVDFLVTEQPSCVFGDQSADRTMVLFGDSHAEQWFGALNAYAAQEGWRLVSWTKAACPVADVVLPNEKLHRDYVECGQWRAQRLRAIAAMHPEAVVTSQSNSLPGAAYPDEQWAAETARTVGSLVGDTDHLVFLGDTPYAGTDVPGCVAEHPGDLGACVVRADETRNDAVTAALGGVGVDTTSVTSWLCLDLECPPVIGDVLVCRDDSHMTQTYSREIEPLIARTLDRILGGSRP